MLPNQGVGLPAGGYPKVRYVAETVVVNNVATAQTAGLTIQNQTAAAAGAQQYSPMAPVLEGQGWKTDAVAASQKVEWALQNRPVQGAANPTSVLDFKSQINSGGWTNVATLTSAGAFSVLTKLIIGVTTSGSTFQESGGQTYLDGLTGGLNLRVNEVNALTFAATSLDATLAGNVLMGAKYIEGGEMTPPAAPAADKFRLYADVSGVKTRLMVIFQSGAAQQIAIEP